MRAPAAASFSATSPSFAPCRSSIRGPFPVSWCRAFPRLVDLSLYGVDIADALCAESTLTAPPWPLLQRLALPGCHLRGAPPAFVGAMTSLVYLDVSGGALAGPLPPAWAALRGLQTLNMSGNAAINGSLAAPAAGWRDLITLDASDTALACAAGLHALPRVTRLVLSGCPLADAEACLLPSACDRHTRTTNAFLPGTPVLEASGPVDCYPALATLAANAVPAPSSLFSSSKVSARIAALFRSNALLAADLAAPQLQAAALPEGTEVVLPPGSPSADLGAVAGVAGAAGVPLVPGSAARPAARRDTRSASSAALAALATEGGAAVVCAGFRWHGAHSTLQGSVEALVAAPAPPLTLQLTLHHASLGHRFCYAPKGVYLPTVAGQRQQLPSVAFPCFPLSPDGATACDGPGATANPAAALTPVPAWSCADGHDPGTFLCSGCLPGYSRGTGRACRRCAGVFAAALWPFVQIAILAALVAVGLRAAAPEGSPSPEAVAAPGAKPAPRAALSQLILHIQLLALLHGSALPWAPALAGTMRAAGRVATLHGAWACAVPAVDSLPGSLVLSLFQPLAAVLLAAAVWAAGAAWPALAEFAARKRAPAADRGLAVPLFAVTERGPPSPSSGHTAPRSVRREWALQCAGLALYLHGVLLVPVTRAAASTFATFDPCFGALHGAALYSGGAVGALAAAMPHCGGSGDPRLLADPDVRAAASAGGPWLALAVAAATVGLVLYGVGFLAAVAVVRARCDSATAAQLVGFLTGPFEHGPRRGGDDGHGRATGWALVAMTRKIAVAMAVVFAAPGAASANAVVSLLLLASLLALVASRPYYAFADNMSDAASCCALLLAFAVGISQASVETAVSADTADAAAALAVIANAAVVLVLAWRALRPLVPRAALAMMPGWLRRVG